jgi:hypothetical protein
MDLNISAFAPAPSANVAIAHHTEHRRICEQYSHCETEILQNSSQRHPPPHFSTPLLEQQFVSDQPLRRVVGPLENQYPVQIVDSHGVRCEAAFLPRDPPSFGCGGKGTEAASITLLRSYAGLVNG